MLAKAVACTSGTQFLAVTPSTLVSKWRGESEKLIKCIFSILEYNKPCILFVDEIDAILPSNIHSDASEHETTARMRAELLCALDGFSSNMSGICVIAATNNPWNISPALLRRFEKRVLVSYPCRKSRDGMLRRLIGGIADFQNVLDKTEGWSGDDLRVLCKEAAMTSVRRLVNSGATEVSPPLVTLDDLLLALTRVKPASSDNPAYLKWFSTFGST
jgi:katanin p60 ATPase-containing subunit A1